VTVKAHIHLILVTLMLMTGLVACTSNPPQVITATPAQPISGGPPTSAPLTSHLQAIQQAGTIKVGTAADFPPFEYIDAGGQRTGLDIELMDEIAKRLDVKIEWVDKTFDELIPAVEAGQVDAAISAFSFSQERDQRVDFTVPYFTPQDVFLAAEGFNGTIDKPEDAAAFRVGVQADSLQDKWLTEKLVQTGQMAEANLVRYDDANQAIDDLKSGAIDLVMADSVPAKTLIVQVGGLKIVYSGMVSSAPVHIVIPNGDVELERRLNEIIQQLQAEGFIDRLAVKYLGGE
jgi:polar amino acid transport system substrate-binding protein